MDFVNAINPKHRRRGCAPVVFIRMFGNFTFIIYIITILSNSIIINGATEVGPGVFEIFEKEMLEARAHQAVLGLSDVLLEKVEDRPKEIEITCPGDISPKVTIRDLMTEAASAAHASTFTGSGGECMVLKLTGHNFNFILSLNCEEMKKTDMRFSNADDDEYEDDGEDKDGEVRDERVHVDL